MVVPAREPASLGTSHEQARPYNWRVRQTLQITFLGSCREMPARGPEQPLRYCPPVNLNFKLRVTFGCGSRTLIDDEASIIPLWPWPWLRLAAAGQYRPDRLRVTNSYSDSVRVTPGPSRYYGRVTVTVLWQPPLCHSSLQVCSSLVLYHDGVLYIVWLDR